MFDLVGGFVLLEAKTWWSASSMVLKKVFDVRPSRESFQQLSRVAFVIFC